VAPTREIADLISMTERCYRELQGLLERVPEGRLSARVGEEGLPALDQFFHACGADYHYLNLMDGGTRRLVRPPEERGALREMLQQSEGEVVGFLSRLTPEELWSQRQVKWREGPDTCFWLFLHMIGHKYYHIGQLCSILHTLEATA